MNTATKLFCVLAAGSTLAAAAPAFADSPHYRDYGRDVRHSHDYRHDWRDDGYRHGWREFEHRRVVTRVVERPYVVERVIERPVYYQQQPQGPGLGAIIGAAIGTIYDNR